MQQIYRNVDKAMAYNPEVEERPTYDLYKRKAEKVVHETNLTAIQAARLHKKQKSMMNKPAINLDEYVPKGFRPDDSPLKKNLDRRTSSPSDFDQKNGDYAK